MSKRKRIFVAVDTETTGLSLIDHGIIQIGAYATGESYSDFKGYFVEDANPFITGEGQLTNIKISDQALAVNGFTLERIEAADPLDFVIQRFVAFLTRLRDGHNPNINPDTEQKSDGNEIVLVFHNAKFDAPRLELVLDFTGCPGDKFFRRTLCTITQAFTLFDEMLSLAKLAEKFDIKNGMTHDALGDAITTAQVFHKMREASNRKSEAGHPKVVVSTPVLIPHVPPFNDLKWTVTKYNSPTCPTGSCLTGSRLTSLD